MRRKILLSGGLLIVIVVGCVFWILPAKVERTMNRVVPHAPYAVRTEAARLHQDLFVADLHSDSLLWNRDLLQHSARGHVDLPRLQAGNVALQVFSATTKVPAGQNYDKNRADSDRVTLIAITHLWPLATWSSIYERARFQLDKLKRFIAASEGAMSLILSKKDLRSLLEERSSGARTIGALYLIEGAHPLEGNIENLDRLFEQGLRIVGLTHFFDNQLGGSLHGESRAGLTDFGREVVRRADELELMIDIAHASPQMVRDVLAITERPVILSHGGVKGVCDTARNLDDALMIDIASRGGLLGIGYWDAAVCDISPAGIVDSIRYAIDLVGADHVALGSDFDGATTVMLDTSELAALTQIMIDRNFGEDEIRKVMGENTRRFFLNGLPD